MTPTISIEELILGYCIQVEGIVEPPAYGVYEVLLPDEVAARWKVLPHQHFTFATEAKNALHIHFGHPIAETIVDEVRAKTANGHFFINNVRPEKPNIYETIEKSFSLPNAKMFSIPGVVEKATLHHYGKMNFKVSLIADEKSELILTLWMDLQSGYSVKAAEIERVAFFDEESQHPNVPPAGLLWSDEPPLSPQALMALLDRARRSAALEMGDTLASLQKRLLRFLELDRARLNEYYDDLHKDIARRLLKAEEERRPALEAKATAIENERISKLHDVEQKYHLRIQMELVNLAIIAQPKIDVLVEIRKRRSSIKRRITWDPLLHRAEGLPCDVCERPGYSLKLCENGHLVHDDCLAPQCIECNRTFCQKCTSEVQTCAVCNRPVCVHSLNRCKECERATCQEHNGLCHSEAGQPHQIQPEAALHQKSVSESAAGVGNKTSSPNAKKSANQKPSPGRGSSSTPPTTAKKTEKPRPEVTGESMEVYSNPNENNIVAIVKSKKREIATREWIMTNQGIGITCWCEKPNCSDSGLVLRPADSEELAAQMLHMVNKFAEEYGVSDKKISFFHIRQGQSFGETKLKVPTQWKDPATLEQARSGFEELRVRNRNKT